jgi:hypothetical protein
VEPWRSIQYSLGGRSYESDEKTLRKDYATLPANVRKAQRWITHQFAQNARLIDLVGGVLLVGAEILDLWSNRDLIRTFVG